MLLLLIIIIIYLFFYLFSMLGKQFKMSTNCSQAGLSKSVVN